MKRPSCAGIAALVIIGWVWNGAVLAQGNTQPSAQASVVRVETVEALLAALKRQGAEKGRSPAAAIQDIEARLVESRNLLAAGKDGDAGIRIESAYQETKRLIAAMQSPTGLKSGSAALADAQQAKALAIDTPELRATYARREASVVALLDAIGRIAAEQGALSDDVAQVRLLLGEARTQAGEQMYPAGIALLERAYGLEKSALAKLRGGTEQVASKSFTSPAEEFRYELSRNEDYSRLINELVKRGNDSSWSATADKCQRLRQEAEKEARQGQWGAALARINLSTHDLKGILKRAGFPIM